MNYCASKHILGTHDSTKTFSTWQTLQQAGGPQLSEASLMKFKQLP
jgi:hypothetical protein